MQTRTRTRTQTTTNTKLLVALLLSGVILSVAAVSFAGVSQRRAVISHIIARPYQTIGYVPGYVPGYIPGQVPGYGVPGYVPGYGMFEIIPDNLFRGKFEDWIRDNLLQEFWDWFWPL